MHDQRQIRAFRLEIRAYHRRYVQWPPVEIRQLQLTVTTDQHWLKLDAGSEYDREWQRYFSLREEERVTELAEATAAEAELLDSALKWRSATGGRRLWIVLVLHKERSRLIRAPGQTDDGSMQYVETVLPWTRFMDLALDQQQLIIVERIDQVLDELARRVLDSSK
jgi:hypothetical protein